MRSGKRPAIPSSPNENSRLGAFYHLYNISLVSHLTAFITLVDISRLQSAAFIFIAAHIKVTEGSTFIENVHPRCEMLTIPHVEKIGYSLNVVLLLCANVHAWMQL